MNRFTVTINGRPVVVEDALPATTLLDYLRTHGYTGTKCGCGEGDCGACTVALVDRDAAGKTTYRAINSCIALLPMFAGREIITVDGLADGDTLHPVQSHMVREYGSQCGYCTPGFVVSLFEAYYRTDCRDSRQLSDQLSGNLCRCTGYRPIRDAALAALEERDGSDGRRDPFKERLGRPVRAPLALRYEAEGEKFFRPDNLGELLSLLHSNPGARLVAGATEIGVDITKKFASFPFLISTEGVAELTQIRSTQKEWRIGGGATLTAIEEAVAPEYPSLARMLRVFASRGIRNRATMGGNLATASPIGDSAPVLLTMDASLLLASESAERVVPFSGFFLGYRKTALQPGEIIKEIIIPRGGPGPGLARREDFLKVSKRRELDISIVAAAFSVDVDSAGIVRRARLAYGGVALTPGRAEEAEAALEGRSFADAREAVSESLRARFMPIDDVRGSAAYRRGLIVSLWEKFHTGEQSIAMDGALEFSRGERFPETDASRALAHESGRGHVTGTALYVDDLAQRRPMLEAWPVCSTVARGRIRRRSADKARGASGVTAVLMAEDIPGVNNVGTARRDELLFAADDVMYHGQLIALVVGRSLRECRAAAALVEVEYEPRAPIIGIESAEAEESWLTEPHILRRGDCAAALAASPHRLDGEFSSGGQEHFYLETHAAWAEPGEYGTLFVCSSTQHPTEIQTILSELLGLSRNKIVVQAPRMGGAFGGKEVQGNTFASLVALAALKTGQPVRLQLDRDLDIMITGKRHPFRSTFSAGYDDDGRLLAVRAELVSDGGWSLDLSQPIIDRALFHVDNVYYIPAVLVTGRVARTNTTSQTAFRGFGGPQGMLVIEEIIDRVARRLGIPPEVVRSRNMYHGAGETNTTHYGEDIGDNRLQAMWLQVQEQARFAERRRAVDEWNRSHPRVKRGIAVTSEKFGISFTLARYNQGGALVLAYTDGTVQVNHGGTEMGQGLNTKVLGVAMRELGLPADRIRIMPTSTDKVPNTPATAASSGADLNGAAVRNACVTLRERLAPLAAQILSRGGGAAVSAADVVFADGMVRPKAGGPGIRFAELCEQAYVERVSLSATGYYATPGIRWDWEKQEGHPFYYFACGAAVSEVEVDGYTGMHRVLRVDIVHDVGDSLNPGVDRGQIEGGFVQGMGWLTREELAWDRQGRLLTHGASTYQIPAISDAPLEFHVTLFPRAAQAGTIHGSKAVGEPPLMLSISVREAIRDAISAFGPAGGEIPLPSPATSEAIFMAIEKRRAGVHGRV
ncbi:MAG TPA: xanthine dehydrogenase molybdopterin binding subunit [Spirochaetia bacterium]|nr:xanthine dehydrogenase molybdopterin binding subunit [Spirochaetia bacterium]